MIIEEAVLLSYNAKILKLNKGEILFSHLTESKQYFQIKKGTIKMASYHDCEKEFIHSILDKGMSVGETFLFSSSSYFTTAIALEKSEIFALPQNEAEELFSIKSIYSERLLVQAAKTMHYNNLMMHALSFADPTKRILTLFSHLRETKSVESDVEFSIPFTRQQIASMTGLRVETVIRTIKRLQAHKFLEIIKGKIILSGI